MKVPNRAFALAAAILLTPGAAAAQGAPRPQGDETGTPVRRAAREPSPEEVERARTFYEAGAQAYGAARYSDAARAFTSAYELAPRAQLLFSLAQAERKNHFATNDVADLHRAIAHYTEYLAQVASGGRRSEATEAKADLEARLARLDPQKAGSVGSTRERQKARVTVYSATPGARVSVDGGAAEELPYFADITPGIHRLRVFAPGYFDAEQDVSGDKPIDVPISVVLRQRPALVTVGAGAGADLYVDGRLVATAPLAGPVEVSPGVHVLSIAKSGKKVVSQEVTLVAGKPLHFAPPLETNGQRLVAYTLLGVGGASLVAAGACSLLAFTQESRAKSIEDERANGNISVDRLDTYNRSLDQRDTLRSFAIGSSVAGAVFLAGAAVVWFADRPSVSAIPPRSVEPSSPGRPAAPSVELTAYPVVGPGGWGAGASLRF